MKRTITILILFFLAGTVSAQKYVDLLKFSYGSTGELNFTDSSQTTDIQEIDLSIIYPIKLNDQTAIITGVDYSRYDLKLFPADQNETSLHSTTLRLGINRTYNDRWSAQYLLLPKIASDYTQMGEGFQMGALALFNRTKSERMKYKFGLYGTSETFSLFFVPILGMYYLSENEKFELNALLPISLDANFKLTPFLTPGFNFKGFVRSYPLNNEASSARYVHKASQDIAGYLQFNFLDNSLLLQTMVYYTLNDYGVFSADEKIDVGLSAFRIGDDRTRLNPELDPGIAFKLKLVYRFHLD